MPTEEDLKTTIATLNLLESQGYQFERTLQELGEILSEEFPEQD